MTEMDTILRLLAEVKPGLAPAPDEELIRSGKLDSVEVMALVMEGTTISEWAKMTMRAPTRRRAISTQAVTTSSTPTFLSLERRNIGRAPISPSA